MLILSRRPAETVLIGEYITVTVLHVSGNKVRLGIHAPNSFPIYREENYLTIKAMEGNFVKTGPSPIAPQLVIHSSNKEQNS